MANGPIIGIDLGISSCSVGIFRDGKKEIIPNDQGNKSTPSYVAFTDTGRLVGEAARDHALFHPENAIFRRLTKGQIDQLIQDAERFQVGDREERERLDVMNDLEEYAYNVRFVVRDERLRGKFSEGDMSTVLTTSTDVLLWLETNKSASKDEVMRKKLELEAVAEPVIAKLYQGAGR